MYYGASLFTSITPPPPPPFCSWVLLFLNFYGLKTSVEPYRSILRPTTKFVKFVGGAVRRESAAELENPLNVKQTRLLDITCEIYWFFQ